MKKLTTFILCLISSVAVFAQSGYNTVTINFKGHHNQLLIDGRTYTAISDPSNSTHGDNLQVIATDLAPGRHVLQIFLGNNPRAVQTSFTLRENYDLTLNAEGNGRLQLRETYRSLTAGSSSTTPMPTGNFNLLMQEVRNVTNPVSRINFLNKIFANTSNYFSTWQARKLIQTISGEPFRLQLAKAAVRSITDTRNIYSLNSILASQRSRNELADYIRSYTATQTTGTNTNAVAMSEANFSAM
ncbi:MAG: DUF4476 domain-containing protein, partial [Ferruginibacter sp.]